MNSVLVESHLHLLCYIKPAANLGEETRKDKAVSSVTTIPFMFKKYKTLFHFI